MNKKPVPPSSHHTLTDPVLNTALPPSVVALLVFFEAGMQQKLKFTSVSPLTAQPTAIPPRTPSTTPRRAHPQAAASPWGSAPPPRPTSTWSAPRCPSTAAWSRWLHRVGPRSSTLPLLKHLVPSPSHLGFPTIFVVPLIDLLSTSASSHPPEQGWECFSGSLDGILFQHFSVLLHILTSRSSVPLSALSPPLVLHNPHTVFYLFIYLWFLLCCI